MKILSSMQGNAKTAFIGTIGACNGSTTSQQNTDIYVEMISKCSNSKPKRLASTCGLWCFDPRTSHARPGILRPRAVSPCETAVQNPHEQHAMPYFIEKRRTHASPLLRVGRLVVHQARMHTGQRRPVKGVVLPTELNDLLDFCRPRYRYAWPATCHPQD